jgi:hypothetical protein
LTQGRRTRARQFIAPNARAGNGHGYLTQPQRQMPIVADPPEVVARIAEATSTTDEPECISEAILDAYGKDARSFSERRHRKEVLSARERRKDLPVKHRIADVERRAKQQHVNLRGDLFNAKKTLGKLELSGRPASASLVALVEKMEEILDGPVSDEQEAA